ncbi:integral membrane regulator [Streptomyces platensis]|uniref:integral membrane regulator n=1 Tax=Streptomyces platensis TaxID=58346 RepID=UPI002E80E134|nr:integral membrane regulator [Streptomyces platensis]WTI53635.1 integral membrane regulator [Streptomyces platensis]WUB80757.1 integral membrane regulator [Streptomyces platensis]
MSDPTRTSQSTRHATDPAAAAARTPAAAVAPTIRRPLAAAFRAALTVAALTGLVLATLGDPAPAHLLTRFAVQANLALALVSAGSAHRAWTGRRPVSPRLTGALLCFLALPALVHYALPAADTTAFTLPGTGTPTAAQALSRLLLHGLTPLAALADWLLLTAPRGFRLPCAWQWPAYPLLYLAFALAFPATAGAPPPTVTTALTLALAVCLLPLITIGIDQVRPSPRLHKNRISPTGISPLK